MTTQSRWRGALAPVEMAQRIASEPGMVDRRTTGAFSVPDWPGVRLAEYTPGRFRLVYRDGTEREWTWDQLDAGRDGRVSRWPGAEGDKDDSTRPHRGR